MKGKQDKARKVERSHWTLLKHITFWRANWNAFIHDVHNIYTSGDMKHIARFVFRGMPSNQPAFRAMKRADGKEERVVIQPFTCIQPRLAPFRPFRCKFYFAETKRPNAIYSMSRYLSSILPFCDILAHVIPFIKKRRREADRAALIDPAPRATRIIESYSSDAVHK